METCLAEVPVVVGYLRPAILVPVGMFAAMPASQIEAILTHELAHIRRHDYLVNLLQTIAGQLLFYHPAVWWISRVIRTERENCCDDLVVAASGDAPEYAAALTALEQSRRSVSEAVLAATGGSLMKRIRRLLYPLERPRAVLTPVVSAGILTITAALALMAWQSTPTPQAAQSSWDTWVTMDVGYIITDAERTAFQNLRTDEEPAQFVEQFWLRRDPTPGTPENEFRIEHYRRIVYANAHLDRNQVFRAGRRTAGESTSPSDLPTKSDSHHSPAAGELPYEDWLYRWIEGIGANVTIKFVDTGGVLVYQRWCRLSR